MSWCMWQRWAQAEGLPTHTHPACQTLPCRQHVGKPAAECVYDPQAVVMVCLVLFCALECVQAALTSCYC